MSETETHKGKATPVDLNGLTVEEWIQKLINSEDQETGQGVDYWVDELFEWSYDNFSKDKYFYNPTSGILYELEDEKLDADDFVKIDKNPDGSFEYFTSFYNGGVDLNEVLLMELS